MKIESIEELNALAVNSLEVHSILSDRTIGRKKASDLLFVNKGYVVSEKLVRTWRNNQKENETTPVDHTNSWGEFFVDTPKMPKPAGPAYPVYAIHIQDQELYAEANVGNHVDRLSRYTGQTPVGPVTADHVASLKKAVTVGTQPWGSIPENQAVKNAPTKRPMTKTSQTIVVMPDVQAPLHDEKLTDKFVQFLADYEPDELAQVGDFTDSTEISRWVRGKKPEFAGDLQQGFDISRYILKKIREVFDGRFRIVRSNHDDRLELYIQGCAPGLASLRALTVENLVGFSDFNVEFIRDEVVELTPTARDPWIMAHGDEGALNSIAGRTAFNLAKNKFGVNVVCGHTHRAGLTGESYGYNGKIRAQRQGLEVGHFMDLTKADYLKKKGVSANWQQAFGILHIHGSNVYPQLVQVDYEGNFSVEGQLY
jgi:hypothetical protein